MKLWTAEQLAYHAGLFDGEGSVGIYFQEVYRSSCLRVQVVQNSGPQFEAIVRELIAGFGGAARYQKTYRGNTKCCYDVSGDPAAYFLTAISPFVRLKAEQVALGIAWQTQRQPRQRDAHGRVVSRENAGIDLDRQACELMKLLKTASIAAVSILKPDLALLVNILLHPDVLAHHAKSVRVLHTLTPLGVAMAGEDVADPFKD